MPNARRKTQNAGSKDAYGVWRLAFRVPEAP